MFIDASRFASPERGGMLEVGGFSKHFDLPDEENSSAS
jgi:hypothetical protein